MVCHDGGWFKVVEELSLGMLGMNVLWWWNASAGEWYDANIDSICISIHVPCLRSLHAGHSERSPLDAC